MGKTLLEPRPDDGHPNLGWLGPRSALVGHAVPGEPAFQAGLELAGARLVLLDAPGGIAAGFALEGERLGDASLWLAHAIEERFERDLGGRLTPPGYELPPHAVGTGAPFTAEPAACGELARWFDAADAELADLGARTQNASPPRCWPHHFDLATLVTLETREDGSATKTVGVGLSPGDASYAEPYWYVSPWPYPDASVPLSPLPDGAHWHRAGFTAAILRGGALISGGPRESQAERLRAFLDAAIAASRGVHGF